MLDGAHAELTLTYPDIFAPLWKPARYKGAYGGRGSGKSHFFALMAVIKAMEGKNILCVREVQNTIADSAKRVIEGKIGSLGLGRYFDITDKEIRCPSAGSVMIFRGMKDHTAESIKSLEGFDVAWFEEAQSCTEKSLTLLRPTIRTEGSELWFSWNPTRRTDAVDKFLRNTCPANAVVIKANWSDNPFFSAELEEERLTDLGAVSEGRYAHVWEGDYEEASDRQLIASSLVRRAMTQEADVPDRYDETILGVDVAWGKSGDETVIAGRVGTNARAIPWEVIRLDDTMEIAARVVRAIRMHQPDAVFIDLGGAGKGVHDRLIQLGFSEVVIGVDFGRKPDGLSSAKVANKRAEMWVRMKEALERGDFFLPDDALLDADLTSVEYGHDAANAIILEKKDKVRERIGRSPDRGDALALTFAYPVHKRGVSFDDDYEEPASGRGVMGY